MPPEYLHIYSKLTDVCTVQGDAADEEAEEHDVGRDGRHPDHLAGGLDPLPQREVDEHEDRERGERERGLDAAQAGDALAVLHLQHAALEELLRRARDV